MVTRYLDTTYKILYDSTYRATSYSDRIIEITKKGLIRESNSGSEIYFIQNGASEETKIFDFNLKAGSELTIGFSTYSVHSTDSVDFEGVKRKVLYFSEDGNDGLHWISGVGANQGLFYFQYPEGILLCVKENNQLLYKNTDNYGCVYYDFVSSIERIKTNRVELYPNPTSGKLNIKSQNTIKTLEIYNSIGERVLFSTPLKTEYHVDFNKEKSGIYFIRINNTFKKIIKK